jgi:hypothetical protein
MLARAEQITNGCPGGNSPYRGFIVSGAGSVFLHHPFPEVRRFISRNQIKMKLPRVFEWLYLIRAAQTRRERG